MKPRPDNVQIKRLLEEGFALSQEKAALGRDAAIKIIDSFKLEAGRTLESWHLQPHWKEVIYKREDLEEALTDLEVVSDWLQDPNSDEDRDWYEALIKATCAVNTITYFSRTLLVKHQAGEAKGALLRGARAGKPHWVAFVAAVDRFRGPPPYEHPHKEADSILDAVNQELKTRGFKPKSLDAIYRRLLALSNNAD
jgi:hypothetical protein